MAEYLSYTAAAGYSTGPQSLKERTNGAWSFLRRFPDPEAWLALPVKEQRRPKRESRFLNYLFLRHLLPMPASYILAGHHRLGETGLRLMERETFLRYREMALRLGFAPPDIRRQFQALVYLMAWAQRPLTALTLADLDAFAAAIKATCQSREGRSGSWHHRSKDGLPVAWSRQLTGMSRVLVRLGVFPHLPTGQRRGLTFSQRWASIPQGIRSTAQRYLEQVALVLRPGTVVKEEQRLRRSWLAQTCPQVTGVEQVQRCHIEAFEEYLRWVPLHPRFHRPPDSRLRPRTVYVLLHSLTTFFQRLAQWGWAEAPSRPLIFQGDLPRLYFPSPRFLGEGEAARFLQAARSHPDPFTRVCGVTLLRAGLRKGEFLALTADCLVQIGSAHWLRVPLGKLHKDRFIPLHPEVKQS